MASARSSALLERRATDKRRVLTPATTGISSIAKQNASNETEIMIAKYNSGELGNQEMKDFFAKQLVNPYVTLNDKTEIQKKLLDFDVLIEKDRLEAVFKNSPDDSLQKVQAAQALADFYTKRASTMSPGTPAQSQALENAGIWTSNVQTITNNVNRQQRTNLQNSQLTKINQMENSSSERSYAKAAMYQQLRDMANSQGDAEDAMKYESYMEQEMTNGKAYEEQEINKANVKDIKQFAANADLEIAKLTDKTSEELKAKAEKAYAVAQKYLDIGDQLNYTKYLTMGTQAEEKYNKKVASASATESAKMAFQNEKDYSDNIRLAQERYINGQYDPSQFGSAEEEYKDSLNKSVSEWKGTLETIYNKAISADANEIIPWRGKNRKAGDVIDEIQKEYDKINGMENAIETNAVMLKELAPTEKIGGKPKYELVDVRNLSEQEQQLLMPDESGILHSGEMGKQELTQDQYKSLMEEDNFRKDVDYDSKTGKYYQNTGLQFTVLDPESGQTYRQVSDGVNPIQSYASIKQGKENLGYKPGEMVDYDPEKAQELQLAKESGEIRASGKSKEEVQQKMRAQRKAEETQMITEQKIKEGPGLVESIAQKTDTILPRKVLSPVPEKRTLGEQIKETVSLSPIEAGKQIIQNIQNPLKAPLLETKPTVNISNNMPGLSQQVQSKPAISYSSPSPQISYTQAPAVNIPQAVQSGGLKVNYTPTPAPSKVITPTPQPSTLQKIATTVKTTSPFSWLGKKTGWW